MPVASAETQKLVKMYAKEGYRQVAYYTKRGLRSAATGFTIARAIANKLDIAGQSLDSMPGEDETFECSASQEALASSSPERVQTNACGHFAFFFAI